MIVDVEDSDRMLCGQVCGGEGRIVEIAVTAEIIAAGVVSRWAAEGIALRSSGLEIFGPGQSRAGCRERSSPGPRCDRGGIKAVVTHLGFVVGWTATGGAPGIGGRDQFRRMNRRFGINLGEEGQIVRVVNNAECSGGDRGREF